MNREQREFMVAMTYFGVAVIFFLSFHCARARSDLFLPKGFFPRLECLDVPMGTPGGGGSSGEVMSWHRGRPELEYKWIVNDYIYFMTMLP